MTTIRTIRPGPAGLKVEESSEIFDHIAQFASYGFNKSHAAAYAAVGFETAWLKRHHPEAFFAASMNLAMGDIKALAVFAGQMKARSIPIMAPHVNMCGARFHAIRGRTRLGISYGLGALRGVGLDAAAAIAQERRDNGRFSSFADFKTRMNGAVDRKAMVSLVQAGAFDGLVDSRADGVALAEERGMRASTSQMSFFEVDPDIDTREALPEWDRATLLDREFDALGFWLSGHPLEAFRRQSGSKPVTFAGALRGREDLPRQATIVASVIDWDTKGTKSGGVMGILTLSDPEGTYEALAFDDQWVAIRGLVQKKATLKLTVNPSDDGGDLRLMVVDAAPLASALRQAS